MLLSVRFGWLYVLGFARFNSIVTKRLASQGITIKGSGLVKAKMAKAIANNGNINMLKMPPHAAAKDKQLQQRAEKKGLKRQVRQGQCRSRG